MPNRYDPTTEVTNYEKKLVNDGKLAVKIRDEVRGGDGKLQSKAVYAHVEPSENNTALEQDYISNDVQGIEKAYFTTTHNSEVPDYSEQVGAKFVKTHDDNGVFIGSLPLVYPYQRHLELDADTTANCQNWKLSLPSFCNVEEFIKLIDSIVPKSKDSLTWKTIEDINKLADEVDKIPEARIVIEILSQNYKDIPEQIKEQFSHELTALIVPAKEPEYSDLSAYLNAPFPELDLPITEDSEELKNILDKIKGLQIEDANIPLVQVHNKDLTERDTGGKGVFDDIANAIFNQLDFARSKNLITQSEFAEVYKTTLVQGIQTAASFSIEKANVLNQSYGLKVQAINAEIAKLQAKTQLLMLPIQVRLQYAELEVKLKQLELLKVQIEIEKEKYPQTVAQTDLILAQTDGQRLQNEQVQVAIQTGKLQSELTKVQLEIEEASKDIKVNTQEEQLKQTVLSNNQLIENTKLIDAQTQHQLKQVELADIQKITAKAQIKLMAQQLEKEKENLGLIKAQTATALSQLSLIKDQLKASKAQYSDTIDGKPVGGLLGAQIAVNKVQATSYERKAFMEVVSNLQSGWAANKTADIAISSPAAYTPLVVDRAINWGMTKYFNMPNDIMNTPAGYTPYLTDEQMDAEESVSYNIKQG